MGGQFMVQGTRESCKGMYYQAIAPTFDQLLVNICSRPSSSLEVTAHELVNCPEMEKSENVRHQWNSFQCIQKVEEMISKAICQQEDLWNMLLLIHSPPENNDNPTDHKKLRSEEPPNPTKLSPHMVRALKVKLENSMDWCHLALCRLKEIITYNHSLGENVRVPSSISTKWNVPSPLSEPPSLCSDRDQWSPFFFDEQTCVTGAEQSLQDSRAPDDAQGRRFLRSLPSLGLDSDHWDYMLTESDQPANSAPIDQAHQSSSSCPLASDFSGADHELSEQTNCTLYNSCGGPRPRSCGPKRDREETSDEKDTTVSVVFQELKPGDDTKKGIPNDGHRGWKKYGNKTIQNSNFCRGYYKCSMKECGAKKMVQPTDKNPSVFEVTYVGTHTCSSTSTSRRRHRSRSSATAPKSTPNPRRTPASTHDITAAPGANATDILVQTKIARLLVKNQPTRTSSVTSNVSSNPSPNISSLSSELDHPISMRTEPDRHAHPTSMADHPSFAQSRNELTGAKMNVLSGAPAECSPGQRPVEEDIVYLSLREDDGGALGFHSDSLLWQDILSSSCRDQGSWSVDI